jgi:hypothetical protein
VIIDATQSMSSDEELSISFVQVGDDEKACVWLTELDDKLKQAGKSGKGAKFDVVDVVSVSTLRDLDFAALVKMSMAD